MKKRLFTAAIFAAAVLVFILSNKGRSHTATIYDAFDTVCTVSTYSVHDSTAEYTDYLSRLSRRLSSHDADGEIYKLNENGFAEISADTEAVLCSAISYSGFFHDLFDISVNPLCELWEEFEENGAVGDVSRALSSVGCDKISVDIDAHTAKITNAASSVTLGAIAKGYAADALADIMRKKGETSALINLGGNIYALGKKENKTEWKIGIADPKEPEVSAVMLSVCDTAVVTSGDYERYFEIGGRRYSHIIDPTTGYPQDSGLKSATAVGKSAELCDVLSTAMLVGGKERAAALCAEYNIEAVLIDADTIYYTPVLEGKIEFSAENYKIKKLEIK